MAGEISTPAGMSHRGALPDGADSIILESVLREADAEPLSPDVRGMPQAVAATLRDLRDSGIAPDELPRSFPESRTISAVGTAGVRYLDRIEGFRDRTRLWEEALEAPDPAMHKAIPEGPVFLYGVHDFTHLQFRMFERLSRMRPTTAFVLWDEGRPALAFAGATVQRLLKAGCRRLAPDDIPSSANSGPKEDIFSAADRHGEADEVVRRVLDDIEDGVPPGDIAIVHRLDQNFDETVSSVLSRAGVPHYLAGGRPVRSTATGRAALGLLSLLCEEPTRSTLLELVSLPGTELGWIRDGLSASPVS